MGEAPALIPQLRFPQFRSEPAWNPVSLRDASTPVVERVGDRKLTPVSISAGTGFVLQAEKFGRDISGNQYELYTLVRDGDFVYNKGNSLKFPQGCVYQLRGWGQVAAPNVFISFRLKSGFSDEFFQQCFERNVHGEQLKKHITSGARSNGLLNISKEHFFGVEIPTPRLGEQKRIADCLSVLDELMGAIRQKLDALKAHKKGLMQQLFPREGEALPRLRFPEFRNMIGWKKRKLSDLLSEPKRRNRDLRFGSKDVLSVSGEFGCVNQIALLGRSYAGASVENYHVVEMGDVVYTKSPLKRNPYGIIKANRGKAGIVSTLYAVYRPTAKAHAHYLDYYFASDHRLNSYLQPMVKKGPKNDMKVNNSDVLTGEVWAPDFDEQKRIAECLNSLDELIRTELQKLDALKAHKRGLMQQIFPSVAEAEG